MWLLYAPNSPPSLPQVTENAKKGLRVLSGVLVLSDNTKEISINHQVIVEQNTELLLGIYSRGQPYYVWSQNR